MKKIVIAILFVCTIIHSAFGDNNTKGQLTLSQWDVYFQAIQAVSPFIQKGQRMAVFGILEAPTNGFVSRQPIPFIIYTSQNKLYIRTPENWFKDKKLPKQNIRQEDIFKYRNNIYETREYVNGPFMVGDNEISIFDLNQYPNTFILKREKNGDSDWGYFFYSIGKFFYAIVDEDGKFHGVTFLQYGSNTPYNREYYLDLAFDYFMNIWFARDFSSDTFYNFAYPDT